MNCKNCGCSVNENEKYCGNCGTEIVKESLNNMQTFNVSENKKVKSNDNSKLYLGILVIFVAILGFFTYNKYIKKPETKKITPSVNDNFNSYDDLFEINEFVDDSSLEDF